MKIRITYTLYTDGDYRLNNPKQFGCTEREVEIENNYFDYIGDKIFNNEDEWQCKYEAKNFLKRFLCDGISVSYTHYWLLQRFCNIIDELLDFINNSNSGQFYRILSGNQEGTAFLIEFMEGTEEN